MIINLHCIKDMLFLDSFEILLFACENPISGFGNNKIIKRINCTHNIFSPSPVMIVADPFLVVKDDVLYLFYEEYRYLEKGIIKMTSTDDLVNWEQPKIVLQEDFHLSYPWVFQYEGQWYMLPETSAVHEVRLYKAVDNLFDRFELSDVLIARGDCEQIPRMDFCDSSITEKEGIFYLFTTINVGRGNELHLYWSENIQGPFVEHTQSPLIVSDKYGRNGGSLIEWEGKLYRFAQDCDGEYGKNISLFEINELTRHKYDESLLQEDLLTKSGLKSGHQYNFVRFKGLNIVAVDQRIKIPYIGCKVKRLLKRWLK